MSSIPRFEAPSISRTSTSLPAEIPWQSSHSLQGTPPVAVGQFKALARIRAVDVFPTPRAPEQAKSGEGQVVLISGERDIGKSRLTLSLPAQLADESFTLLRFYGSPFHQENPLHPIINQIEHADLFSSNDSLEVKLAKLEAKVVRLAVRQPVMIMIDDLHWIDQATLELLHRLVARAQALPILNLMTCRPDFISPWGTQSHVTTLIVSALPRLDCEVLV